MKIAKKELKKNPNELKPHNEQMVYVYLYSKKKVYHLVRKDAKNLNRITLNPFEKGPTHIKKRWRNKSYWWLVDGRLYLSCEDCNHIFFVPRVHLRDGVTFLAGYPLCVHCPNCDHITYPYLLDFQEGPVTTKYSKRINSKGIKGKGNHV